MKHTKIISFILKVLGYTFGIGGCLLFIGTIGAFDADSISFGQFLLQELIAIISICAALCVYAVREYFKLHFIFKN